MQAKFGRAKRADDGETAAVENETLAGAQKDIARVAFLRKPNFAVGGADLMAVAVAHLQTRWLLKANLRLIKAYLHG